jgi:galactokinase
LTAAQLADRFAQIFGRRPSVLSRAPGRVNLLGEHVDYNQGVALPCGIQFAAHLALAENPSGRIRLAALDLSAEHTLDVTDLQSDPHQLRAVTPDWARLPVGVGRAWVQMGWAVPGWDAAYTCDVPPGSGLSSSAAIEIALAAALDRWRGTDLTGLDMARLCQTAEHEVVGVQSGLMDQWTSACAVSGHALLMDFRDLSVRPVSLPDGVAIVVADTGVRRALASSAYNQRVRDCQEAVAALKRLQPEIVSLRDVSPELFSRLADRLPRPTRDRAQQVIDEIERVRLGAEYLERADVSEFGRLMRASHASLRDLYQVSGPELDRMVEIGDHLEGGYGTRLTGAGFGGSTVSLVDQSAAEAFSRRLAESYLDSTGRKAEVWICQAGDGAKAELT